MQDNELSVASFLGGYYRQEVGGDREHEKRYANGDHHAVSV